MFDIASKFVEYPLWVKIIVVVWVFLSVVILLILLFVKPAKKIKSAKDNPLKFPDKKFSQLPDSIIVTFGNNRFIYKIDKFINKKVYPFKSHNLEIAAYVENEIFYIDANI
jgi:hypothetical protein